MNIKKKIISSILSVAIMFSGAPALTGFSTEVAAESLSPYYYYQGQYDELRNKIVSALENYETYIDFTGYSITIDDLDSIYSDIFLARPDLFYVYPDFQYKKSSNGIISMIKPCYYYDESEIDSMRTELENKRDEILSNLGDNWTVEQKLLYLHDYIATNTYYNEDNEKRTAYEILVNGNGVCVGYSAAMKYLCDEIGIQCVNVASPTIDHSWNMVKIDNKWYHLDVTWDDVVPDSANGVYHTFFLVSDNAIKNDAKYPHTDWKYGYSATSTKYDNAVWQDSTTKFIAYSDDVWYYMNNIDGVLCKCDWTTNNSTELVRIPKSWTPGTKNTPYVKAFTKLDTYKNYLYFNSRDTVYRLNMKKDKYEIVKTLDLSSGKQIFELDVTSAGKVYAYISTDHNKTMTKKVISTSNTTVISEGTTTSGTLTRPKGIKASMSILNDGGYQITLSWNEVANAEGYYIYRYNEEKGKYVKLKKVTKCIYTSKSMPAGTYKYKIAPIRTKNGKVVIGTGGVKTVNIVEE